MPRHGASAEKNVLKQTVAVLLISMGIYSFTFGLYVTARWKEMERDDRLRSITEPGSKPPVYVERSPIRRHPLGLLMLCATGTTAGVVGGIHFLAHARTAKRKHLSRTR
jgi:hypothetical protein